MKVALIFPTWTDTYGGYAIFARKAAGWPPLNLCIVAALAEKEGHEVLLIDAEARRLSVEQTIEELREYQPDFIGFTANTPFYHVAADWGEKIKAAFPDIISAIGGQHITVLREEAMLPGFDVGFIGEAEDAFPAFLRGLEKDKDISTWAGKINGLIYRQKDGTLTNTGQANPAYVVDEMPVPARHLLDNSLYTLGTEQRGVRRMTSIQTVRGCPFKCTFCSTKVFGKNFRRRSPHLVIEEIIECAKEHGSEHFMFLDDTLTMHKKHIIDICNEIISAKNDGRLPRDTSFEGSTRANVVDEDVVKSLAEAGFVRLSFGLESVDSTVRKLMRKQVKIPTYVAAYELTNKHGIETVTSTMIGQPGDTHESIKKTLSFLRWAKLIKRANMSIAVPYPGTEMYEWAAQGKYGLELVEPDFKKWRRYNVATMKVGDLTPEELVEYQNDAYASIYMAPWRWKALLKKDGWSGVWLTFKRLLRAIKKGRFEMLFVSPNYWKSELDRDPEEVKQELMRWRSMSAVTIDIEPKKSLFNIISSSKVEKKWDIKVVEPKKIGSGTMFTSGEKDIDDSVLTAEKSPHKVNVKENDIVRNFITVLGKTVLESNDDNSSMLVSGGSSRAASDLPYSCRMGGCGECRVKLVSGKVLLAAPHCLDKGELADGIILTCRCVAQSDLEIEIREGI